MFDHKVTLSEFIFGVMLAVLIIYLFWKWLERGYNQWHIWDTLEIIDSDEKNWKLKTWQIPNRWLSDTVQYVSFWGSYYKSKYSGYIPF